MLLTDVADKEHKWKQVRHDALRATILKLSTAKRLAGPFQMEDDKSLEPIHCLEVDMSATESFFLPCMALRAVTHPPC